MGTDRAAMRGVACGLSSVYFQSFGRIAGTNVTESRSYIYQADAGYEGIAKVGYRRTGQEPSRGGGRRQQASLPATINCANLLTPVKDGPMQSNSLGKAVQALQNGSPKPRRDISASTLSRRVLFISGCASKPADCKRGKARRLGAG